MLNIAWLQFIFDLIKTIYGFFGKGDFCKIAILISFIFIAIIGCFTYTLVKKEQEAPSRFDNEVNDTAVNQEIKKALRDCGDLSFITWSVLEDSSTIHGKYLKFKTVYGCHKDRTRFREDKDCVIDIKFNNPMYLQKHFVSRETLDFIESDPELPNGTSFQELTPVWFTLKDKNGKDTEDAIFLKKNTGEFWKIINRTNLALSELGVIKVRHRNRFGKPVIYVISISFLPNAEKLCIRAGDHLMNIAKKSIRGL